MTHSPRAPDAPPGASFASSLPEAYCLPPEVLADLRSDHAGETGAVWIYHGILCFARDPALRDFALRHRATEQEHLQRIAAWLSPAERSRLLPLWRLSGWLLGALPALVGPSAVYATVETVERFVDRHYAEQIARLQAAPALHALGQTLADCRDDELTHRDEAAAARSADAPAGTPGALLRAWTWLVGAGSQAAVAVCRRL
jgi:ubiquinone biosynthesis monooxygenase Coq7